MTRRSKAAVLEPHGYLNRLDGDEYIQAVASFDHQHYVGPDVAAVLWPTDLPAAKVIDVLREVLGEPSSAMDGSVLLRHPNEDGDDEADGTSDEIADFVQSTEVEIDALNITYPDLVFRWCSPFRKFESSPTERAECSVSGSMLHRDTLEQLIGATATPILAKSSFDFVAEVDAAIKLR